MKARFVSEAIEFERGKAFKDALKIGIKESVKLWLNKVFDPFEPPFYTINEDGTIDIDNFEVPDWKLIELPPYINFRVCREDVHVDFCELKTLKGMPKIVRGFFSIEGNKLETLDYFPKKVYGDIFVRDNPGKFTKEDVLEKFPDFPITIGQRIYSENSYLDE
jgi:hypothetical protein